MSVEMILNIVGGVLIVAAFIAHSSGVIERTTYTYAVTNLVGASILLYQAVGHLQPGFILLQVMWVLMSLVLLYDTVVRGRSK